MKSIQAVFPVTCGTIMVQEGLLLPEQMGTSTESYSPGWRAASGDGFAFDGKLRLLGWDCFFIAGELRTVSFGSSKAGMLKSAVRRLLSKVRSLDFNCVEFTGVIKSRFLGIPYVSVRGHARHVQHSSRLDSLGVRIRQQEEAEWARN